MCVCKGTTAEDTPTAVLTCLITSPVLSHTQTAPVHEPSLSGHIPASVYFGDNELSQSVCFLNLTPIFLHFISFTLTTTAGTGAV